MPSFSRISRMAPETSSSSRWTRRGAHFDHGDLAAEAAEHLAELEADVAAADHDEMARAGSRHRIIELLVRYVDLVDAGHRRHDGAAADIDEDRSARQPLVADADFGGRFEAGVALVDGAVVRAPSAKSRRRSRDCRRSRPCAPSRASYRRVTAPAIDAEIGARAAPVGGIGAGHHASWSGCSRCSRRCRRTGCAR